MPEAQKAFQRVTWAWRSITDPGSIDQSDGWQADTQYKKVKDFKGQWCVKPRAQYKVHDGFS